MRRLVLLATPACMAVLTVVHPEPPLFGPGMLAYLRTRVPLWMAVHVVQLFGVLLLGLSLWFLTEGLAGRAATVSRLATAFFLVFYAAFDSVAGIGTGVLVRALGGEGGGIDAEAAARLVDRYWLDRLALPVGPLIGLADLAWVTAAIAAALALRARGAPHSAVALLVAAGIAFGMDHTLPPGTIGMLCMLGAVVVLLRAGLLTAEQRGAA